MVFNVYMGYFVANQRIHADLGKSLQTFNLMFEQDILFIYLF